MKTINLIFFIGSILFFACSQQVSPDANPTTEEQKQDLSQKPEIDNLFMQVMEVHDEIMPLMGEVVSLKKKLKEDLKNEPSNKSEIEEAIDGLQNSDDAMMNWMHSFDAEKAKANTIQAKEYLASQLVEVKKMRETFLLGYEKAKSLTNQ